jgi:hypothetical protein
MPATESTWREQRKLHFYFAITGTVLFCATLWRFYKAHQRQWKKYQVNTRDMLLVGERWKQEHVDTQERIAERKALEAQLRTAKSESIAPELIERFQASLRRDQAQRLEAAKRSGDPDAEVKSTVERIQRAFDRFQQLAQEAATLRKEATDLATAAAAAEKGATDALVSADSARRALATAAEADKPAAQAKAADLQKISQRNAPDASGQCQDRRQRSGAEADRGRRRRFESPGGIARATAR